MIGKNFGSPEESKDGKNYYAGVEVTGEVIPEDPNSEYILLDYVALFEFLELMTEFKETGYVTDPPEKVRGGEEEGGG
jgi:hypothetical protein